MENMLQLVTIVETWAKMSSQDSYAALCVTFGRNWSVDPPEHYKSLDAAVAGETAMFRGFYKDAPEHAGLLTRQMTFIIGPNGLERVLRWETADTMLICKPTGSVLEVLSSVSA